MTGTDTNPTVEQEWQAYFKYFKQTTLSLLCRSLRIPMLHPSQAVQVRALASFYARRSPLAGQLKDLTPPEELALALVKDCSDMRLATGALAAMLQRHHQVDGQSVVLALVRKGLLLPLMDRRNWWRSDALVAGRYMANITLFLPGPVADLLVPKGFPRGEVIRVQRGGGVPDVVRYPVKPSAALEYLRLTCSLVERYKSIFSTYGNLRKHVIAATTEADEVFKSVKLGDWLGLAADLRLLEQEGEQRWRLSPGYRRLSNDPLGVLLGSAGALLRRASEVAASQVPDDDLTASFDPETALVAETRVACLTALMEAGRRSTPGAWFLTLELELVCDRVIRRTRVGSQTPAWFSEGPHDFITRTVFEACQTLLAQLVVLSLVEWLKVDGRSVLHFTETGHAAFGLQDPMAVVRGAVTWREDGRAALTARAPEELVELALGAMGERKTGADGQVRFSLSTASLEAGLRSGLLPEEIRARLELLGGGAPLPEPLEHALESMDHRCQPLTVYENMAALEVPGLSNEEKQQMERAGYRVHGELVLLPRDRIARVASELGLQQLDTVSYSEPPRKSLSLGRRGEVELLRSSDGEDLRLITALRGFGLTLPLPEGARLSADGLDGTGQAPHRSMEERLAGALRALEPHVQGPVPASVHFLLRAEAGLVDAPTVEEYLVVGFPEPVLRGLVDLGCLGEGIAVLSPVRLLVPRKSVEKLEELLAELGVPFPADMSAARERLRARAAMSRLEEAVLGTGGAADAAPPDHGLTLSPGPETAPVAAEAAAREETPEDAAGEDEEPEAEDPLDGEAETPAADPGAPEGGLNGKRVLHALARLGMGASGWVSMTALRESLGGDAVELRRQLRQLVGTGQVQRSGSARGTRYRMTRS